MKATTFFDLHSGGGQKEPHSTICIETGDPEARVVFQNRFGHNPERVTCTCCGSDYSIVEHESLATALELYPDAFVITNEQIKPEERQGELRAQGYVWVD